MFGCMNVDDTRASSRNICTNFRSLARSLKITFTTASRSTPRSSYLAR